MERDIDWNLCMVMVIDTSRHYKIDDIVDHRQFLRSLWHVLEEGDVVVLSTYGSTPEIHDFLAAHQTSPDEMVKRERERLSLYADEYPNAMAYMVPANQQMFDQLADLCGAQPADLCDHMFARGLRGAICAFHDAFKSDPLYISSAVEEACVLAFASALGKRYVVEDNDCV